MKTFISLLLLAAVCTAEYNYFLSDEFINEINSKQSTWKAGRNFDPNTPISEIRALLGINKNVKFDKSKVPTIHHQVRADIPDTFDARENWPQCKIIQTIADQSACGSCWAVASASAMSDRVCIATNSAKQEYISAVNIMSCCDDCGYGCEGGYPIAAWSYWTQTGIVTGGPVNTTDGCQNYPFASCEHHTTGSKPACPSAMYRTPSCKNTCDAGWTKSYSSSLTYGSKSYFVGSTEEQIQTEIMTNGPVVADFDVYSDFLAYKSGVYRKTSGSYEGGHAVRVLGWGVENGIKYWLVANSWNTDWGDKGLFKIIRGRDECGFEQEMSAGLYKNIDN